MVEVCAAQSTEYNTWLVVPRTISYIFKGFVKGGLMKRAIIILVSTLMLAGCNSQPRAALTGSISSELESFKASQTSGRVYISTGQEHWNSLTGGHTRSFIRKAQIIVDGQNVAELGPNEIIALDLRSGSHQIKWLWKGYDGNSLNAKPISISTNSGTSKFLQLEFFDDRPAGATALGGMGIIGALASGSMATFRTEVISTSKDSMSGKTLVDYKKL